MVNRIALLSLAGAALAAATLPHAAAAADYYDGGRAPAALQDQDEGAYEAQPRRDWRAPGRRVPGPVVFDERGPDRRFAGPAEGDEEGFADPRFAPRPFDDRRAEPPAPFYRAAAVPGPVGFAGRAGFPDVGCTVEQSQTVTPAGWRKIETHRTCYRR